MTMQLLAHLADPAHNTVAHTLDQPAVVLTVGLAVLVTIALLLWRAVRERS